MPIRESILHPNSPRGELKPRDRCNARKFLEYDHEIPVARGGEATVENIRLRCRAHNQFEAERAFGTEFMSDKRADASCLPPAAAKRTHARRIPGI